MLKIILAQKPKKYRSYSLFGSKPNELYFSVPEIKNYNSLEAQLVKFKHPLGIVQINQIAKRVFVVRYYKEQISDQAVIAFATNLEIKDQKLGE